MLGNQTVQGESESEIKSGHFRFYHAMRQYSTSTRLKCRAAPRRVWNFWWWQAGTRQHMQGPQVEVRKFQKKCKSNISGRDGGCASASTRIYYQEKL